MYLIVIEILLQYAHLKKYILENKVEQYILNQEIRNSGSSWSGFVLKITGLFSLWWNQSGGFKDNNNQKYNDKYNQYKGDAYYMSVLAISIFKYINRNSLARKKINLFSEIELLNFLQCFSDNIIPSYKNEDYLMYWDRKQNTAFANSIKDELINNIKFLSEFIKESNANSRYFFQNGSGYIHYSILSGNVTSIRSLLKIDPSRLFL